MTEAQHRWPAIIVTGRLCRVAMWVEHSFGTENGVQQGPQGVEAHFLSLRDGRPLTISMQGTKVTSCPLSFTVESYSLKS